MVRDFRALGGVIENVRAGRGVHGRGLFAVDPSAPVRIFTPRNLLVDIDDVVMRDNRLTVEPGCALGPDEQRFFARFQDHFSFGAGAREDGWRVLAAQHAQPEAVQEYILSSAPAGKRRYPPASADAVLAWFKGTRSLSTAPDSEGRRRLVLMPVLELLNHSSMHAPFRTRADGIEVAGRFKDEILVRYSPRDTWQTFVAWGFVSPEPAAYSIGLDIGEPGGRKLRIKPGVPRAGGIDAPPKVTLRADGALELSHVLMGLRPDPAMPRRRFAEAVSGQGIRDPIELFDIIAHINRSWFYRLMALCEPHDGPTLQGLRQAAREQLETLSFNFGAPPVQRSSRAGRKDPGKTRRPQRG